MRTSTFKKLDLTAQRIADRLLEVKAQMPGFEAASKPYMRVKQFILDNKAYFKSDMYGEVNLENVCKTTRQLHYLSNEVLHRLRKGKFFKKPAVQYTQLTFGF